MSESKACLQIAFVSTTAEGYEQTKAWVDYHVIIGVTDFYLFVDGVAARPEVILLPSLLISPCCLAIAAGYCLAILMLPALSTWKHIHCHSLLHADWRVIAKPPSHARLTYGRFKDWLRHGAGNWIRYKFEFAQSIDVHSNARLRAHCDML